MLAYVLWFISVDVVALARFPFVGPRSGSFHNVPDHGTCGYMAGVVNVFTWRRELLIYFCASLTMIILLY